MSYTHSESDFAPDIADYINTHGVAYYPEMFDLIEKKFPLTDADYEIHECNGTEKYKQKVTNLRSHNTFLDGTYGDLVNIADGFATHEYATKHGLSILKTQADVPRKPKRIPKAKRIQAKDVVGMAWKNLGKPKLPNSAKARDAIYAMVEECRGMFTDEMVITKAEEIITNNL